MNRQKFETTKSELRSGLEQIAESVRKGELTKDQAKPFRQNIIDLWMMEELGYEHYKMYAGMQSQLVQMDLQTAQARQNALDLQIQMLQAELAEVRRHIEARRQLG